jgi:hypothetical protein
MPSISSDQRQRGLVPVSAKRELANQVGNVGRMIVRGIVTAPADVNRQP